MYKKQKRSWGPHCAEAGKKLSKSSDDTTDSNSVIKTCTFSAYFWWLLFWLFFVVNFWRDKKLFGWIYSFLHKYMRDFCLASNRQYVLNNFENYKKYLLYKSLQYISNTLYFILSSVFKPIYIIPSIPHVPLGFGNRIY